MSIIFLFLCELVGILIELYVFSIVRLIGRMGWAEVKFGPGGTFVAWRLIGIILIFGGFLVYRYLPIF